MEYIMEYSSNGKPVYKRRGFFDKKVRDLSEIFLSKKEGTDISLIPKISGITISGYLLDKRSYLVESKKSDFDSTVNVEFFNESIEDLTEETLNNGHKIYKGLFITDISIVNIDTKENITAPGKIRFCFTELFIPTREYYEALFSVSYSGYHRTMRQEYDLLATSYKLKGQVYKGVHCEDCDELFSNIDELYSHMIECCHENCLSLEEYPYDSELKRVQELINKKREA